MMPTDCHADGQLTSLTPWRPGGSWSKTYDSAGNLASREYLESYRTAALAKLAE